MPTDFYKSVYALVESIPAGKVATYGQIAAILGRPKSARLIGWALNVCPPQVPWQRVINKDGMISIENLHASKDLQAELLRSENVIVNFSQGNWWVDLEKYLWHPKLTK